ncbi:extracellular solute-binding protein [Labrys sp. LIt4]|uniref:sensor histidine kinase n=1 Tax=Labrys sp. LIt4 TaxID=2821355 RepID=UPI001ADF0C44|nr:extracellular solute-binding protein [Labrys sp. LIt4]MBP0582457.1 extracellular solute-binding protein [Labrys sp. LIt4]
MTAPDPTAPATVPFASAGRATASIRRRVLAAALLVLALAALAFIAFIHSYARRAADQAYDRLLTASALTIAGAVLVEEGRVTVELPYAALAMLGSGGDRIYYQVEAPDGALVTGYGDLAEELPAVRSAETVFADSSFHGEAVRVASIGRLISASNAAGWVTIRVAETRGARTALASEIVSRAVLPLIGILLLALALVWFGVQRAFAPLTTVEAALRDRAPQDLSPLAAPVPAEVSQLVAALNDFMRRLASVMNALSGVVADAAHQVRTPLASLRAQAEVALDERDYQALHERVTKIHRNAVHASELVSQLLMEATLTHRLESRESALIPIADLVEDVTRRFDPDEARRLAVTIVPALAGACLKGDRLALQEMLRNLAGNALLYAPGSAVEIMAGRTAEGRLLIRICDRGPGIPEAEKETVLQRFQRGHAGAGTVGSGLGLPIARTVAQAHGGSLSLHDRPGGGLEVRLELPLAPEQAKGRAGSRRGAVAPALAALTIAAGLTIGSPLGGTAQAGSRLYPAPVPGGPTLSILGTTDTPQFELLIQDFQELRPDVSVTYEETDTLPLYQRTQENQLDTDVDLLVSSAADLQVKLANDGHALAHASPLLPVLPAWASWRSEIFGFTFEPIVIVYNRTLVPDAQAPHSHLALTELLEKETDRFRGKVATYDIGKSGVGHLLAAQDAQISSNFWRLTRALGRADVRLSGSSPAILEGIASGSLALGYNVLGSYAYARQRLDKRIGIVIPDDYALILTRVMLVPRWANQPDLGRAFIDYALSPRGQAVVAGQAALGSIVPGTPGGWTAERISAASRGVLQPITLGPALLVALDQERKARFLATWRQLVTDGSR